MGSLAEVKGQKDPVRFLSNILSSRKNSGSYLFSGPRGVGKAFTAAAFIGELLSVDNIMSKIHGHPDIRWISPEPGKVIRIGEMRELKDFLNAKPFVSVSKVAVIEDAHMMNIESFNALLKVFEEPPGDSMIMLISDKRELIPETVLSRCFEIRFSRLPIEIVKDILILDHEVEACRAEELALLSQGSIETALLALKEGLTERREKIAFLAGSLNEGPDDVLMTWDTKDKNEIERDLDVLIMLLRDMVFVKEGFSDHLLAGVPAENYKKWKIFRSDEKKIYDIVSRLIEFRAALKGNINPRIISQALPAVICGHLN